MTIDENTKIIGRFHSKVSPRGLNIYNPLFEELGINALYLLFCDKNPKVLFDGLRNLKLAGAVTVGFENDPVLTELVDQIDDVSKFLNAVGFVTQKNGIVIGHHQGGEAFCKTVDLATSIEGKKLILVGAGHISRNFLYHISRNLKNFPEIEIYNRTPENAEKLAAEFKFVTKIGSLDQLVAAKGDILANASKIGGGVEDIYFTREVVNRFLAISDITFESENTNLIQLAKECGKKYSTGWDMFTFQGQIVLETILETKIPFEILKKHVVNGLSSTVK